MSKQTCCDTACPGSYIGPLACQTCEYGEQQTNTLQDKGEIVQTLKFTLPIVPKAQARPKVTVRGNFATAYKTADQKTNERTLESCLLEHRPKEPLKGPLVLEFVAALPAPKSASKKARRDMLLGMDYPTKKPDIDNIAKLLTDAMTRLQFWGDDAQIVSLRCEKIYAETGYWQVAVYDAVRRLPC
jgi:Holliday junction resolvase RusA-like endonuclease